MTLMEGPSFIARTAAKRREKRDGGKVVVHPVAIRYLYSGNIEKTCNSVLNELEHRLTWRSQSNLPLVDRLAKTGDAMLTLKELEYDAPVSAGMTLRQRQSNMVNHLLNPIELEWLGSTNETMGMASRIKNVRMKIFPDLSRKVLDQNERLRRWRQLEDTYLAQQIDGYPENYVGEHPSVDRMLEMIEKFEEDLTDECRIHGNLKVILDVCEPIEVSTRRDKSAAEDPLMKAIRESLQSKLLDLQAESKMY